MYIKSLIVKNYGPFEEAALNFRPTGMNIILGANATGKTQLFGAIRACIEGKRYLEIKNNGLDSLICAVIVENDEKIEVGYSHSQQSRLKSINTSENFVESIHEYLAFENTSFMFVSDENLNDYFRFTKNNVLNHVIDNLKQKLSLDIFDDYFSNIDSMCSNSKRVLHFFISEYISRSQSKNTVPLIIDVGQISYMGSSSIKLVFSLIKDISNIAQVLLFLNDCDNEYKRNVILQLENNRNSSRAPINYRYQQKAHNKIMRISDKDKKTYKYTLGSTLESDENINTEYKEVKGNNAVNSIKDIADQYIVAFLNTSKLSKGSIYWGVTDSDRKVVGVKLDYNQRDDLRRNLIKKLHEIQPIITPSCYRVILHGVKDGNKWVYDTYVVEVTVSPYKSEFLFCTGKKEVFVKTDGGKKKLTPYEVQLEFRRRIKSGS